jgi:hypothetical protein
MMPDAFGEKTTFRRYIIDALANWEGKYRITGTALDGDSVKTWQAGLNYWDAQTGHAVNTPSPLHFWEYNTGLKENCDTTLTGGETSPWMQGYLIYGLGRLVELGISEATPLLAWVGQNEIDTTQQAGVINPKSVGQYRIPDVAANGTWMTTWAQVAAGYGSYNLDGFWASGGIDQPLNGYPYIAQAALSMTTNLTNGAAAWSWISPLTTGQALQNDYPTWAILPRAYTPPACSISPSSLGPYTVGDAVSQVFTASNCTSSTWGVTGSWPTGLTFSAGTLSGTASAAGTFTPTVSYDTASNALSVVVSAAPSGPTAHIQGLTMRGVTFK